MHLPKNQARLLSPHELLQQLDEDISESRGTIGVASMQIVDVGYFARKFGLVAVEELTR